METLSTLAENILADDAQFVWHPFTQAATSGEPLVITRSQGATVWDANGNRYIDGISAWWTNVHGHSHPKLVEALHQQAATLDHIQFAGATHPQAVQLAKNLSALYPKATNQTHWRSFFSDNGSTAVEVALKIAYQYHQQAGQPQRTRFLALDNGYHGDTVGAMSVGFGSGFYDPFEPLCFPVHRLPVPTTWLGDNDIDVNETEALAALDQYLADYGDQTCAFIGEPSLQGAGGMAMTRPQFWNGLIQRLKASGILVIADEVLTGFGRTGKLFATEHLSETPDLVCLSKGLTGGMSPMGVTLVNETLANAFLGKDFSTAFAHGHSYTANPISCAVANASLALFNEENTLANISKIESLHREQLNSLVTKLSGSLPVYFPRVCGLVGAVTLGSPAMTYDHPIRQQLYQASLDKSLLLRPVGNVAYLLPPACIQPAELHTAYDILTAAMEVAFKTI